MRPETISICICTFRRPSLERALASIAAQDLPPGVALRVVVADNDTTDCRRTEILGIGQALGLDLHYVHAPAGNISIARNACLDAAVSDWIAFIDDDEEAAPDWIAMLIAHRADADIVFGVSQALYSDPGIAPWVAEADLHSNRIAGNDAPWNGYTANVMIDRRVVERHGLRFAEALGQTGGEDTAFFLAAHRVGARFGYAPRAIVYEETAAARANFAWLARRRFRSGQIHFLLQGRGRCTLGLAAAAKAMVFGARALTQIVSPDRGRQSALRGLLHAGVVASALGFAPYREYRPPTA
ncbi:glycosyltransferase family 2 protein [Sphingomonas sp. M1A8_2b]